MFQDPDMTTDGKLRPWRAIAYELARESDFQRIIELSDELNAAVAEQGVNDEPDLTIHPASRTRITPH